MIVFDTNFKCLKTYKFIIIKGLQKSHPLGSIPRLSRYALDVVKVNNRAISTPIIP